MPRYSNSNPGISKLASGYRARLEHGGRHFEKRFATIGEAKSWRANLKSDLKRCPDQIEFVGGKWEATMAYKHVVKTEAFVSIDEAIAWVERAKAQIRAGVFEEEKSAETSFGEFVDEFMSQKEMVVSKATLIRYASTIENHLTSHFGDTQVRHIDRPMVRGWIKERVTNGASPDSIRKAFTLLREIMFMAEDEGLISANPIVRMTLPAVHRKTTMALSSEQVAQLADLCGSYRGMILFMAQYGLRDGEMRSLKVGDVGLADRVLVVDSSFTKASPGSEIEGPTKTRRSRLLPLTESALALLEPYCEGKGSEDYLFTGEGGGKLNYGWFRRRYLKPAGEALGIERIGMHVLRHTAASLHSSITGDDVSVAKLLGHSRVSTTQNHYIHKSEADLRKAVEAFELSFT